MYCDISDIEAYYLNKTFKCDDYVSNKDVETFIVQDGALINALLRSKYTLPFTNNDDLLILKMLNEKMVVGTIDDIIREKTEAGDFDRTRGMRKEALDWLKKISEGELTLQALMSSSSVLKFNNVDSDGNEVTKRFKNSNIEPGFTVVDRERRTTISSN
jgi:phage gp36-like protein